jgi:modulator of FtsH protease HflC
MDMRLALVLVFVALLAVVASMSVFTVNPAEFVYLTQFGRHVETYDGGLTDSDAGLHLCWPWPIQSVRRLDRRLQYFDLPSIELLTRDPGDGGERGAGSGVDKTLTVEAYVCWRIAGKQEVDRFVRRIDTGDRAKAILGQRVNSELGAFIGQMRMDELVSTDMVKDNAGAETMTKVDWHMELLRKRLLDSLHKPVLDEYGIQIVDIRLRRFNHPVKVRDSIFARIVSERRQISARYESEGAKKASDIKSVNDSKIELLAKYAEKVEKQAKAEADKDAELIRLAAYSQDKTFFKLWNELEQMRSFLGSSKTTLLLSTSHPMFESIFRPPAVEAIPRPVPSESGTNSGPKETGKKEAP